jgi:hypothetical protein
VALLGFVFDWLLGATGAYLLFPAVVGLDLIVLLENSRLAQLMDGADEVVDLADRISGGSACALVGSSETEDPSRSEMSSREGLVDARIWAELALGLQPSIARLRVILATPALSRGPGETTGKEESDERVSSATLYLLDDKEEPEGGKRVAPYAELSAKAIPEPNLGGSRVYYAVKGDGRNGSSDEEGLRRGLQEVLRGISILASAVGAVLIVAYSLTFTDDFLDPLDLLILFAVPLTLAAGTSAESPVLKKAVGYFGD